MPPPRKRPRTKVVLDIKHLKLDDVMCPVCRSVIIEPVSLPCEHSLCYFCFDKTIESNTLTCPVCRKRIGGWLRSATKSKSLINQQFWSEIQKQFPKEVECKQAGEDDGVEENVIGCGVVATISNPGEIGQEFKEQLKQFSVKEREEQEKQEKASAELAKKLMEEELRAKAEWLSSQQKVVEKDAELAKSLALEESKRKPLEGGSSIVSNEGTSKDPSVSDGPSIFVGVASRFKSGASSTSSNSSRCNSIDEEFRHFTPILPNRDSNNKPQKSAGPSTISNCTPFFKNIERVRPIKPHSTLNPETSFEKPQGPHRLHVMISDDVAGDPESPTKVAAAFSRVHSADDQSSDTDFEDDDDRMAAEGNKMAAEGNNKAGEGSKMVKQCEKATEGSNKVAEELKIAPQGSKMVKKCEKATEGTNKVAEGSKIASQGSSMAGKCDNTNEGSNKVAEGSKIASQGSKIMAEGSKMVEKCDNTNEGSNKVAEGSRIASQGSNMASEESKMAEKCVRATGGTSNVAKVSNMETGGSKIDGEGSTVASEGSKMASEGSNGSIFADDVISSRGWVPSSTDKETTSAVVKSVVYDEVSFISNVTADVTDVEKIYSELEKRAMELIRQEEEDRKLALQMQEIWEKAEQQRAKQVTSDYKLRRKEPVTVKRTVTPKGKVKVPGQTTLDKHVQQVRS
ncbi:E3 ubiquitin-protein ligase rnf168 [Nilaparvata lugens]|uniref:E3 ubiquitin-protein ligase rnf168 n=1 Tax=Nilaparvata lugens TaxID=108931 RepID=UPI00193CFF7A|nr:E3 ubiquitin-protein ligase rnf168 [Nilaparvata lugens]